MTAVTVAMKIRVVFVELHVGAAELLISAIGRPLHDTLPRPIVRQQIFERATFRGGIFGVGMVVIKPGAVRQHQVTFHVVKRIRAMGIQLGEVVLLLILLQTRHPEASRILVRIFPPIIPSPFEISGQMRTHQLHRLLDRINRVEVFSGNGVFRLNAE